MKIKSVTDVITNSSSEIFTIKNPGVSKSELEKILEDYHKTHSTKDWDGSDNMDSTYGSGCGGEINVSTFMDIYKEQKQYYPKTKQHLFTPEVFANSQALPNNVVKDAFFLNIDKHFAATCKYIFDNYEVLEHDGGNHYPVYDEKGEKIVRVVNSWDEWENSGLTELEQYGKLYCDNYQ